MSFDVSGLSTWVDENKMDLIRAAILKGRTADIVRVQGGIKNSATINILGSTFYAQNGGSCGWNASGTTDLTQRTLSVCDIKVNEGLCLDTLEDYYTSAMMNPGSYNEEVPFEELYATEKMEQIQALVDDLYWRGNTETGSGNLSLCNGIIQVLENTSASASTVSTTGYTGFSASNAIDAVDAMINDVPDDIIDAEDLVLFMSYSNYRTWAKALRDANLFHYNGAESQGGEFTQMVPGTNVRVMAVRGLNNSDRLFLSRASNFYLGTDLLDDTENFKIFYSEDNDEVRFLAKWKQGANVAFPAEVVVYDAS